MPADDHTLCHHAVDIDHQLRDIGRQVLLIPALHPRNTAEEREGFLKRRAVQPPTFEYRPLAYDAPALRSRVRALLKRADRIHSPWLRAVFRAKCRELSLKLSLVGARGTPDFLPFSMRLFPRPTRRMVQDAEILARLPHHDEERVLDAAKLDRVLRQGIRHYRRQHRSFACRLRWVDSSLAEASVSDAQLNIRKEPRYSDRFLRMLEHHEIGVHLVTAQNGDHQRLNIFRGGLAGYDQTQEGLALFAEFQCGAVTTNRLRVLGARVLAVDLLCRGARFHEVYGALTAGLNFGSEDAFAICLRCFRGGGYTKDVIYQPGFLEVFNYWIAGGDLSILFLGKFPLSQVRHVKEAVRAGLLRPPVFIPPMLGDPGRLHAQRTILSLLRVRRPRLSGFLDLARAEVKEEERESHDVLVGAAEE